LDDFGVVPISLPLLLYAYKTLLVSLSPVLVGYEYGTVSRVFVEAISI
jgi:hypothetical protein